MKFFEGFGSCCGGATVTPAAETATAAQQQGVVGVNISRGRRLTQSRTTKHWKPALNVISEDNVVPDVCKNNEGMMRSEKKQSSRAKSKATSYNYGDEYWKSSHPVGFAALSPTPHLF
ncbi:unnamed protein product [Ilex paraguariensis]|uniref:Uncharacterized protein n=1 Tax=Ilex paraguariensis TaxID=185542 RepID=A0ABC8SWF0_9AQUA